MGQISAIMQIMEQKISVKCGAAQLLIKKIYQKNPMLWKLVVLDFT